MNRLIDKVALNLRCPGQGAVGWFVRSVFKNKNTFLEVQAVDLCEIEPHHKVLEVGFGLGYGLNAACSKLTGGAGKVYGIDMSSDMVERASNLCQKHIIDGKLDVNLGNIMNVPYNKATFDRVFHCNCYYFWPDLDLACKELHRVMKPHSFMVTTLNLESLKEAQRKGFFKYARYDPLPYMTALEKAGFHHVHIEYLTDPGSKNFQAIFAHVGVKQNIAVPDDNNDETLK